MSDIIQRYNSLEGTGSAEVDVVVDALHERLLWRRCPMTVRCIRRVSPRALQKRTVQRGATTRRNAGTKPPTATLFQIGRLHRRAPVCNRARRGCSCLACHDNEGTRERTAAGDEWATRS